MESPDKKFYCNSRLVFGHAFHPAKSEIFKKFKLGLLGVFSLICLVESAQVLTVVYHFQRCEKAQNREDLDAALFHYERAGGLSGELDMGYVEGICSFRMAEILAEMGKIDAFFEVMPLEEDFVRLVNSEDWGRVSQGGQSCLTCPNLWKQLMLYKGKVEFQIYAGGIPTLGAWPRMLVKLDEEILGEVLVDTRELKPYSFPAEIRKKGRQWLKVFIAKDLSGT